MGWLPTPPSLITGLRSVLLGTALVLELFSWDLLRSAEKQGFVNGPFDHSDGFCLPCPGHSQCCFH